VRQQEQLDAQKREAEEQAKRALERRPKPSGAKSERLETRSRRRSRRRTARESARKIARTGRGACAARKPSVSARERSRRARGAMRTRPPSGASRKPGGGARGERRQGDPLRPPGAAHRRRCQFPAQEEEIARRPARSVGGGAEAKHGFEMPTAPVKREVALGEAMTVGELAQKMAVKATEVIKVMMNMGVMATINQPIEQDTAVLVVEEMGHTAKLRKENQIEEDLQGEADAERSRCRGRRS
jgi:translation initiation factor IF-2